MPTWLHQIHSITFVSWIFGSGNDVETLTGSLSLVLFLPVCFIIAKPFLLYCWSSRSQMKRQCSTSFGFTSKGNQVLPTSGYAQSWLATLNIETSWSYVWYESSSNNRFSSFASVERRNQSMPCCFIHIFSMHLSCCFLWMKAILPANDASLAQNQTITYCCNLVGKLLGINLLLTDLQILPLLPKSNLACLILVKLEDIHAMPLSKKKLQIICLTIIINFTYVFTFRNSYCISIFIVYC